MKAKFYVVFDRTGAQRMTKKYAPSMYREEVAVGITVTIPDSVFREPIINATITVAEDQVILPPIEIEAEQATEDQTP